MAPTQIHQNPPCPTCTCKLTVKKGVRRNRLQTLQVFRCTECLHRFTGAAGKNKTYPLKIILESISTFNLGYSLTETQRVMRRRYHREIPERTISSWLNEYRPLSTYARLRLAGRKLFRPESLIRAHTFHHQQVYRFQSHQAKLEFLTQPTALPPAHNSADIASLKGYLASIETHFPHHLFHATEHRSSKFPAELHPPIARKENHATRAAALALPTSPNNNGMAALGLRTSNNRSMSIQLCAGLSVFVCDNMVFRGDLIALNRKHTSGLHLRTEINHAILRFQDHFARLTGEIANLKENAVSDTDAKAILHDVFVKGILPIRLLPEASSLYFEPFVDEFRPRTAWSLHNAFTAVAKEMPITTRMPAIQELGRYFGMTNGASEPEGRVTE